MGQLASKTGENNTLTTGEGDGLKYEVISLPHSKVEVKITIDPERFKKKREEVYEELAPETQVKGFRPGKAPRKLIEAKLGARLFEDTISKLIPKVTTEVISELEYRPLDYAEYKVQELKKDMTLVYSAIFTIFPEVTLPDFKDLKVEKEIEEVKDKEVEEMFEKLEKEVTESIKNRKEKQAKAEAAVTEAEEGEKSETKYKDKESKKSKKSEEIEIDWGEELGREDVETKEDVKEVLKENIKSRRESEAEEKYMADIVKGAVELAKIEAPKSLVDDQVEKKEKNYKERIENLGLELEDFLKTQQTSLEDLRESWREEAEFQIASDILFMTIADKHDLEVKGKEIDEQIKAISDERLKSQYKTDRGRGNIATILMRQKSVNKLKELMGIEVEKKAAEKVKKKIKKSSKPAKKQSKKAKKAA